ncbi:alpha/beta fold hydrolase [Serinicoccus kebangsaanensis]|uniref:alpha/beta fold hydrolase n=1 Tax=Serinicoccus kebangsaanensis TaxID=2602069 RepID=UPI00124EE1A1|nr:alpha/beta hydrolase [Serinicoccus kebangsaanensis]
MAWSRVPVGDATLEVDVLGEGEPVLWIQTALLADELVPCARHVAATGRYASVLQHRRGYAGSSPAEPPGSVDRDAADVLALLSALDLPRVHVVGLSYAGAVALEVARVAPQRVATLTLIEPPPRHVPAAEEFVAANRGLLESYRRHGPERALEEFLTLLAGPGWVDEYDALLPGCVAQMSRDAATFFDVDIPALLGWELSATGAGGVSGPVLSLGGSGSGPWFAQVREWVRELFPAAEERVVPGAGHDLALTHHAKVARSILDFLQAHPVPGRPAP